MDTVIGTVQYPNLDNLKSKITMEEEEDARM